MATLIRARGCPRLRRPACSEYALPKASRRTPGRPATAPPDNAQISVTCFSVATYGSLKLFGGRSTSEASRSSEHGSWLRTRLAPRVTRTHGGPYEVAGLIGDPGRLRASAGDADAGAGGEQSGGSSDGAGDGGETDPGRRRSLVEDRATSEGGGGGSTGTRLRTAEEAEEASWDHETAAEAALEEEATERESKMIAEEQATAGGGWRRDREAARAALLEETTRAAGGEEEGGSDEAGGEDAHGVTDRGRGERGDAAEGEGARDLVGAQRTPPDGLSRRTPLDGDADGARLARAEFESTRALAHKTAAELMRRIRAERQGEAATGKAEDAGAPRLPLLDPPEPLGEVTLDASTLRERRLAIEAATRRAWGGFARYAWGTDELRPINRTGSASFGGLGATPVDSLDTLAMMGLEEELAKAREWVADGLDVHAGVEVSVFETVIRVLGGLLSAHELTGDELYLSQARKLGVALLPAYATPSGLPANQLVLSNGTVRHRGRAGRPDPAGLAELGTQSLEFYKLTELTGDERFADAALAVLHYLRARHPSEPLLPISLDATTGAFRSHRVSMGAVGDSYYEYLLKLWLLDDRKTEAYRDMWQRSTDAALATLLQTSVDGHTYLAEKERTRLRHKMDHLACFYPGMVALGLMTGAVADEVDGDAPGDLAERDGGGKAGATLDREPPTLPYDPAWARTPGAWARWAASAGGRDDPSTSPRGPSPRTLLYAEAARNLTETCYAMYARQPTGLSPEYVSFDKKRGMKDGQRYYLQRPEAIEAFWYLYRLTGEDRYREYGWRVFLKLEEHCRVAEDGYAGVKDVTRLPPTQDDVQQSFFIAETLKYLWLLFSEQGATMDLSEIILNTEAHPLRVRAGGRPRAAAAHPDHPDPIAVAAAAGAKAHLAARAREAALGSRSRSTVRRREASRAAQNAAIRRVLGERSRREGRSRDAGVGGRAAPPPPPGASVGEMRRRRG